MGRTYMDDGVIVVGCIFGGIVLILICAVAAIACRNASQPPHAT